MEYSQAPYTEKFPIRYTVTSKGYVVHTCNKEHYDNLLQQIADKNIEEFTPQQVTKLQMSSFTVIKRG